MDATENFPLSAFNATFWPEGHEPNSHLYCLYSCGSTVDIPSTHPLTLKLKSLVCIILPSSCLFAIHQLFVILALITDQKQRNVFKERAKEGDSIKEQNGWEEQAEFP